MRTRKMGVTPGGALLAALGAAVVVAASANAAWAADPVHGKEVFQTCAACHSDKPDAIGPSLRGVFGRKSASLDDFRYSNAMIRANLTWDEFEPARLHQGSAGGGSRQSNAIRWLKRSHRRRRRHRLSQDPEIARRSAKGMDRRFPGSLSGCPPGAGDRHKRVRLGGSVAPDQPWKSPGGSCRDARNFLYRRRGVGERNAFRPAPLADIIDADCHYRYSPYARHRPDRCRSVAEVRGWRACQFDQRVPDRPRHRERLVANHGSPRRRILRDQPNVVLARELRAQTGFDHSHRCPIEPGGASRCTSDGSAQHRRRRPQSTGRRPAAGA